MTNVLIDLGEQIEGDQEYLGHEFCTHGIECLPKCRRECLAGRYDHQSAYNIELQKICGLLVLEHLWKSYSGVEASPSLSLSYGIIVIRFPLP